MDKNRLKLFILYKKIDEQIKIGNIFFFATNLDLKIINEQ